MSQQVSLFETNTEMEKLRKEALKSKRSRFKNPTYVKFYKEDTHTDGSSTDSIIKYGRMNQLYSQLANYFPFPLAFEKERYSQVVSMDDDGWYIDTGIVRTYKIAYKKEKYTHRGDDGVIREYEGEEFFLNFAEIIGSEDFGINERLFLHEELIKCLEEGYPIEKLNMWIDELINMMLNGFTAELLIVLLLNLRCKDVNI